MLEVGETYSNLTILEVVDWPKRKYRVKCKCGREYTRTINSVNQLNGYCKSCRPLPKDRKNRAHPEKRTKLYYIWRRMKSRCDNPKDKAYATHGGRGITYPPEWRSFAGFKEWAEASGYEENKYLQRTTDLLDFSPFNCEWVTYRTREDYTYKDDPNFDPEGDYTLY